MEGLIVAAGCLDDCSSRTQFTYIHTFTFSGINSETRIIIFFSQFAEKEVNFVGTVLPTSVVIYRCLNNYNVSVGQQKSTFI